MRGKQGIAAVVAGALIVLAVLAVFAVTLSNNQSESRHNLEYQAHQRAELVAGLMDSVFQSTATPNGDEGQMLGTPIVADRVVQRYMGKNDYAALVDPTGRVLAHSTGFNSQARLAVRTGEALKLVRSGRPWGLGNIFPYGRHGVINLAETLHTSQGTRYLVTGMPVTSLSTFALSELRRVPGAQGQHQLMVDGNGVVIASTVADRPAGYRFHTAVQMHVLHSSAGVIHGANGVRYFDHVDLGDTSWVLLLTVPTKQFFASVSGFRHWLPWVIFVAFGIVAIVALVLVQGAMTAADRIRATNAKLTESNSKLGTARVSLQESNLALGRSNGELERQARELVRSNGELDQFASIASHDLQEPLRKVRTFTERVSETEASNLSERGLDYLRRANASAERMQTLIEDLLRFSRVSTQDRPFTVVDLGAVMANVLDDLSEQVARDGAQVIVGDLPTINADGSQMRQLLQNLVSNGLKFRREGVIPEVTVEARVDAGWLTMTVADNGIGFDQQYAQRIFRVFERLHGRGTYPGTGIGLALCRKIAERHGGNIVADSVPDQGTCFTVTLQTERSEAVSDAPSADRPTEGSAQREETFVAV